MRSFKRTLIACSSLTAVIAVACLSPAGSAGLKRFATIISTNGGAYNAYVFLNTNPSGGGVSGQNAASQYTVTAQSGVFGVFAQGTSHYGNGVNGLAQDGFGVVGQTLSGNYAGVEGQALSGATGPGVEGISTNSANAVFGTSSASNAVLGQTTNTTNEGTSYAGVMGIDATNDSDSNGRNVGVFGSTTNGLYGVMGTSSTGAVAGVYGTGTNGYGAEGVSSSNIGVFGASTSKYGVYGLSTSNLGGYFASTSGAGVEGVSSSNFGSDSMNSATDAPGSSSGPFTFAGSYSASNTGPAVYGVNLDNGTAKGFGVTLSGQNDAGVLGYGNDGPGIYSFSNKDFGALITNNGTAATLVVNSNDSSDTDDYEIASYAGALASDPLSFAVRRNGDVVYAGSLVAASATRDPQVRVQTYASKNTQATVEDLGSAQLVNGVATVPLAADFRATMNPTSPYMVFLTPYGDNKGLYVASRTAAGFVVRETQSGRSTLSFDYRIVGRPFGDVHTRLARVDSRSMGGFNKQMEIGSTHSFAGGGAGGAGGAADAGLKHVLSVKEARPLRLFKDHMPTQPPATHFTTR